MTAVTESPGAPRTQGRELSGLPIAFDEALVTRLAQATPLVLLDYDGTLTPIVARPELAIIDPGIRMTLERLAARVTVGIISGRDLDDVRQMIGIEGLWYAGSHGFDLMTPDGTRREVPAALDAEAALDRAAKHLRDQIHQIHGAWVEQKRFAVAVHFRQTPDELIDELASIVSETAGATQGLRMTGGKKIFELRPDLDWDKGKTVEWVSAEVGHTANEADAGATTLCVYIGDDETDEDAFGAVQTGGIGIVVGTGNRTTQATYRLADPAEVGDFLVDLERRLSSASKLTGDG